MTHLSPILLIEFIVEYYDTRNKKVGFLPRWWKRLRMERSGPFCSVWHILFFIQADQKITFRTNNHNQSNLNLIKVIEILLNLLYFKPLGTKNGGSKSTKKKLREKVAFLALCLVRECDDFGPLEWKIGFDKQIGKTKIFSTCWDQTIVYISVWAKNSIYSL